VQDLYPQRGKGVALRKNIEFQKWGIWTGERHWNEGRTNGGRKSSFLDIPIQGGPRKRTGCQRRRKSGINEPEGQMFQGRGVRRGEERKVEKKCIKSPYQTRNADWLQTRSEEGERRGRVKICERISDGESDPTRWGQ